MEQMFPKQMNLTYNERVLLALDSCETLEQVDEVIKAIEQTQYINRRTKAGRELTAELLEICRKKAIELINTKGLTPF